MDTSASNPSDTGPRTLRRGLTVLRALQEHPETGLNITALSRETGLQRPTIYRLLAALMEAGFVRALAGTKRYAATMSPPAAPAFEQDARIALAYPSLRKLAEATGDAVFLVVRDGYESLSLWREIGAYPVQILATYAGKRQPLGVGSGGMALLAKLNDDTVESIIDYNSDKLEQYGGMSTREMRQLVLNTRTRGYSVVGNYAVRGALGVGCALCDAHNEPLLAISVTAITERMPATRQREIAAMIQEELKAIAGKL
ncbi:helix-turn-helix domain-containing protein [Pusillimonas sp. TS35]|uniref:IclR family transcriptional regulator n=1 Tax=Paracandidimonas lactea TaxID=2895524 RepID=UPI0013713873|nr:helix-turn-helix domain-containing protein [Pusillimonas sp. TS35]